MSADLSPEEFETLLTSERDVTNETEFTQLRRVLKQGSPVAAQEMLNLVKHSDDEKVRLAASKAIIDAAKSFLVEDEGKGQRTPLEQLLNSLSGDGDSKQVN